MAARSGSTTRSHASRAPENGVSSTAPVESLEQAVLAATLDPVVVIDGSGVIQSVSNSIERVFGWKPHDLVGRNVTVLMPQPYRRAHNGYLRRYRQTGRTNILNRARQFEAIRRSGEIFPIELCVSRADVPGRDSPLFVGIIRDLAERKRFDQEIGMVQTLMRLIGEARTLAEAMHHTLREILRATGWDYGEVWLRAAPGVDGTDPAVVRGACWPHMGRRFAGMRAGATRLTTSANTGLVGRMWGAAHSAWIDDLAALPERVFLRRREAKQAGLNAAAAIPIRCEEQTEALLLLFLRRGRQRDDRMLALVSGAVAPLGQLIRRRSAEDALARHHDHLEQLVRERTDQLEKSRAQLHMADRMASIGTLAAGLGHDMNNVLLPVRARLNALRASQPALPEAARQHLEGIQRSIAYLQQLADGLHYLALDPEREDATESATDLAAWWAEVGVLIGKAAPKQVRLTAVLADDLPQVSVPAHGLTQAVLNLVVNAGEAIASAPRRRAGRIRIDAEPVRRDGRSWVRLSVIDNGPGMSEEVRRRAFEMFFTTKPRGLGTGLGLSLVRKVVEGAGGAVEIESEPGRGATVSMLLPVAAGSGGPDDQSGAGLTAWVTLSDGRAGSLVRHFLESAGVRAADPSIAHEADLWVIEPTDSALVAARSWRGATARGRVVLWGQPPARRRRAWRALKPVIIAQPDDLDAVRGALAEAVNRHGGTGE